MGIVASTSTPYGISIRDRSVMSHVRRRQRFDAPARRLPETARVHQHVSYEFKSSRLRLESTAQGLPIRPYVPHTARPCKRAGGVRHTRWNRGNPSRGQKGERRDWRGHGRSRGVAEGLRPGGEEGGSEERRAPTRSDVGGSGPGPHQHPQPGPRPPFHQNPERPPSTPSPAESPSAGRGTPTAAAVRGRSGCAASAATRPRAGIPIVRPRSPNAGTPR